MITVLWHWNLHDVLNPSMRPHNQNQKSSQNLEFVRSSELTGMYLRNMPHSIHDNGIVYEWHGCVSRIEIRWFSTSFSSSKFCRTWIRSDQFLRRKPDDRCCAAFHLSTNRWNLKTRSLCRADILVCQRWPMKIECFKSVKCFDRLQTTWTAWIPIRPGPRWKMSKG